MRKLLVSVLFLVAAGCGGDNIPIYGEDVVLPGQEAALQVIWKKTFKAAVPAPKVFWVLGDALNCKDGRGFQTFDGCAQGITIDNDPTFIQVAHFEELPFGDGPQLSPGEGAGTGHLLAHEACHALASQGYATDYDVDGRHGGTCFAMGGLVDQANASLVADGL